MSKLRAEQKSYERGFYAANSITTRRVQIRHYLEFVERFAGDRFPFPILLRKSRSLCDLAGERSDLPLGDELSCWTKIFFSDKMG